MFSLAGKTAIVTGGGAGIGAAICRAFADQGATVCVVDRNAETAKETAGAISERGGSATFHDLDISDESAVNTFCAGHPTPDILVNNAGIGHVGTILETKPEDLDRLYSVNVRGVFLMCRAFLPGMLERESGSLINLASIGGVVGIRDRLAYCTTKFAVVGMTKSLALDHAKSGVRINCICPGRVETEFVKARLAEYPDADAARREMTQSQPVGRMGQPEEIAAAAVYLASYESAYVTGSEFIIDGGWSAG